jgi:hypothetical protein
VRLSLEHARALILSVCLPLCAECKDKIAAAKVQDDAAELVLENANKAFNTTVKQANEAVAKAVSAQEAANTAVDTAQDTDNRAKMAMNQQSNEFNNAVLRLQDVVTLCSQPQPPSDCRNLLQTAEDNVKCERTVPARATQIARARAHPRTPTRTRTHTHTACPC